MKEVSIVEPLADLHHGHHDPEERECDEVDVVVLRRAPAHARVRPLRLGLRFSLRTLSLRGCLGGFALHAPGPTYPIQVIPHPDSKCDLTKAMQLIPDMAPTNVTLF